MRPAVEVWRACNAAASKVRMCLESQAAATIIEQDRAALVAEIVAWLTEPGRNIDEREIAADIAQMWGKV